MHIEGLRSPYDRIGGLFYFGRMLDKIRLKARGELPEDYFAELGQGFDGRTVRYLRVDYNVLVERVLEAKPGSDEEILGWCYAQGRSLSEEDILIFNSFMSKRGWRDDESFGYIADSMRMCGLEDDGETVTDFDVIQRDEGRPTDRWRAEWQPQG